MKGRQRHADVHLMNTSSICQSTRAISVVPLEPDIESLMYRLLQEVCQLPFRFTTDPRAWLQGLYQLQGTQLTESLAPNIPSDIMSVSLEIINLNDTAPHCLQEVEMVSPQMQEKRRRRHSRHESSESVLGPTAAQQQLLELQLQLAASQKAAAKAQSQLLASREESAKARMDKDKVEANLYVLQSRYPAEIQCLNDEVKSLRGAAESRRLQEDGRRSVVVQQSREIAALRSQVCKLVDQQDSQGRAASIRGEVAGVTRCKSEITGLCAEDETAKMERTVLSGNQGEKDIMARAQASECHIKATLSASVSALSLKKMALERVCASLLKQRDLAVSQRDSLAALAQSVLVGARTQQRSPQVSGMAPQQQDQGDGRRVHGKQAVSLPVGSVVASWAMLGL